MQNNYVTHGVWNKLFNNSNFKINFTHKIIIIIFFFKKKKTGQQLTQQF